jgi:hypothetical protein
MLAQPAAAALDRKAAQGNGGIVVVFFMFRKRS